MDPEVVLPNLDPVGYHAWADPNTLLLFVLGEPATLRLADLRTARVEIVAENVGRSIHKIPTRNAFSFTQRVSDDETWITELDPNTKETTHVLGHDLDTRSAQVGQTQGGGLPENEEQQGVRVSPRVIPHGVKVRQEDLRVHSLHREAPESLSRIGLDANG